MARKANTTSTTEHSAQKTIVTLDGAISRINRGTNVTFLRVVTNSDGSQKWENVVIFGNVPEMRYQQRIRVTGYWRDARPYVNNLGEIIESQELVATKVALGKLPELKRVEFDRLED